MSKAKPSNRARKPATTRRFDDDENANRQTQAKKNKKKPILFEDSSSESEVAAPIAPPKKISRKNPINVADVPTSPVPETLDGPISIIDSSEVSSDNRPT